MMICPTYKKHRQIQMTTTTEGKVGALIETDHLAQRQLEYGPEPGLWSTKLLCGLESCGRSETRWTEDGHGWVIAFLVTVCGLSLSTGPSITTCTFCVKLCEGRI